MCEFKVFLDKKIVLKDAVYVKVDGNNVILKDVLGVGKTFEDCKVTEVDVGSERLTLSTTKKKLALHKIFSRGMCNFV